MRHAIKFPSDTEVNQMFPLGSRADLPVLPRDLGHRKLYDFHGVCESVLKNRPHRAYWKQRQIIGRHGGQFWGLFWETKLSKHD